MCQPEIKLCEDCDEPIYRQKYHTPSKWKKVKYCAECRHAPNPGNTFWQALKVGVMPQNLMKAYSKHKKHIRNGGTS